MAPYSTRPNISAWGSRWWRAPKKGVGGKNHVGTFPAAMDLPEVATKGLCATSTLCSTEIISQLPARLLQVAG